MRFTLPVTPATLPRLEALRAAALPARGCKPPVLHIPEADAVLRVALGPRAPKDPGRWLVASVGPVVTSWDTDALPPGLVHSVEVDVLEYVAPVAPTPPELTPEQAASLDELLTAAGHAVAASLARRYGCR